jgi:phosphatidylglycerophosphate synthase
MTESLSSRVLGIRSRPPGDGPVLRFIAAAIPLGVVALWLGTVLGQGWAAGVLTLGLYGLIAGVALHGLRLYYPHRLLGLCNLVTLFRAAMVAALSAVLVGGGPPDVGTAWAVALAAGVTLALDGVDGWLARSSGLVSGFGARFDMEVDSIFALVLSLVVWQSGKVGDWVLLLGTMRYIYVVATWVWPWLDAPITRAVMRRKTVCVIQIATLVILIAPVIVPPVSVVIAAVATVLLVWSFATDIVWLYRGTAS